MPEKPEEPADITGVFSVVSVALDLTRKQWALLFRVLWVLVMTTVQVWVVGGLAWVGFAAPFAKATDQAANALATKQAIQGLSAGLLADRAERLDNEIFQTRRLQCDAIANGTSEQKSQYAERLRDKVAKYHELTNQYPRVPECDEV